MPDALRSDGKTFIWSSLITYIWQEDVAKIRKVPGAPHNLNVARAITCLEVGLTIYYTEPYFKSNFFHLASFYAKNTFKRITRGMLIEQIIQFEWRGIGPLAVHVIP